MFVEQDDDTIKRSFITASHNRNKGGERSRLLQSGEKMKEKKKNRL